MRRPLMVALLACLAFVYRPIDAFAQSASNLFRFQVAGGLSWTGSYPIGDSSADLLQNAPGQPPPVLTLFRTSSTFESTPGVEGRFGIAITPRLMVEVGGAFSKPKVLVEIAQDTETTATSFDGETVSQYVVDVSLIWEVPVPSTARVRPFVIGGGGYLRQLHEDESLVETGQLYHFGGGARLFFHGAASGHPFGIRGDVQAAFRRDGIEFNDERRVMPTVSVLLFFGF